VYPMKKVPNGGTDTTPESSKGLERKEFAIGSRAVVERAGGRKKCEPPTKKGNARRKVY